MRALDEMRRLNEAGEASGVGAFLLREEEQRQGSMETALVSEEMYDVGSFAQVHFPPSGGVLSSFGMSSGGGGGIGSSSSSSNSNREENMQILLMGHRRVRKVATIADEPLTVLVSHLKDVSRDGDGDVTRATAMEVVSTIKELLRLNPMHKEQLSYIVQHRDFDSDAARLADIAAALTTSSSALPGSGLRTDLQEVMEELNVARRLEMSLHLLKRELELARLQADIARRVEEKVTSQQRRHLLMEQLKSIKKELGMEKDEKAVLVDKFSTRFDAVRDGASEQVQRVVDEELLRLGTLDTGSSEYSVVRNYLDWLTSISWGVVKEETLDLDSAKRVLDADHFGLDDVKERILELIAVRSLGGEGKGKILLLVGPPGVGKTSIAKSVAKALDRAYYRFSVGGLSDVAEIRGHRRTYVGAMPGKPVQCLKAVKCINPLVLIDEVDKVGHGRASASGSDPSSALLELLDPEQNASFVDFHIGNARKCGKLRENLVGRV